MLLKPSRTKKSVELDAAARPSRIRRDPARMDKPADSANELRWRSSEWEIKLAIFGIVAFALAIDAIIVAVSVYWG